MEIFIDKKADRIVLTQVAHPFVAWGLLLPMNATIAVGAAAALRDGGIVLVLLAAASLAAAFWLARLTIWIATEAVAAFDGAGRALTITWSRPWGETKQVIAFPDVHDVVAVEIWLPDGKDHRVDIMLAGERKVRLRSNGGKIVDDALDQVRRMIRRPPPQREGAR